MDKSNFAWIYLITTIILWSFTPALSKIALGELNNYQLLFYTSIIGVLSLFAVNFIQGKISLLLNFKIKDYLTMFGMGFLGIYLYYIFLYGGYALGPAGQLNIINYLWPIFVIIFSIPILKEKFNFLTILAIFISFFGAFITFTNGNFTIFSTQYTIPYLLVLIAGSCFGLFSVLGKKLVYEKFTSMLVYYISAAMLIIPTTILISGIVVPKSLMTIISILILGGITNSVAWVFWFKALKLGDTYKMANTVYAVPFLALVWTFFLNSEPISIFSLIGLTLIVSGIIIQLKNKR